MTLNVEVLSLISNIILIVSSTLEITRPTIIIYSIVNSKLVILHWLVIHQFQCYHPILQGHHEAFLESLEWTLNFCGYFKRVFLLLFYCFNHQSLHCCIHYLVRRILGCYLWTMIEIRLKFMSLIEKFKFCSSLFCTYHFEIRNSGIIKKF